jgi:replication initiation factor
MSADQRENRPPPTNKGGRREKIEKSMQILVHLDWLSYTVPWDNSTAKAARRAVLPVPEFRLARHWGDGLGSYDTVLETDCGALLAWNKDHPQFKIFASMTGSVLTTLGEHNIAGRQLIEYAFTRKAKFTRIDVAIDLFNCGAKVNDIRQVFVEGGAITRAKAGGHYVGIQHDTGKDGGETLYVGSTQSERWLRVYNKQAEMGTDYEWVRIELVSKKALAQTLADAIAREGVPNAGRQAVRQFFRLPTDQLVATCLEWAISGDGSKSGDNGSPKVVVREGYPLARAGNRGRRGAW